MRAALGRESKRKRRGMRAEECGDLIEGSDGRFKALKPGIEGGSNGLQRHEGRRFSAPKKSDDRWVRRVRERGRATVCDRVADGWGRTGSEREARVLAD